MANALGFMTVGDLRRALEPFADDMEIVVSTIADGDGDVGEDIDFTCGLASVSYETAHDEDDTPFLRLTASDEPDDGAPYSSKVSR